jgi:hypothetical protein
LDFARFLIETPQKDFEKSMPKTFYKTIEKKQNFLTQNPTSFFSKIFCCVFFRGFSAW